MKKCNNCLTTYDSTDQFCPGCGASSKDGNKQIIQFNDNSRYLISNYGGIYGGIVNIPNSSDKIIWCETGIFRCSPSNEIKWSSEILGLIDNVKIENNALFINGEEHSLETGKNF